MTSTLQLDRAGDADLAALSLEGDQQAYCQIVERYQSVVCSLTYAACGDVQRSEDLAQETFVQAWKHLRDLQDRSKLRAWLCGIARNLSLSERRKQNRAPAMAPQPPDDAIASPTESPAQQAIGREQQELIWQTLQRLPADYREPMVLYYRNDESVAAVAEALEISETAVRQRLSRGRAMIADRIESLVRDGLRSSRPGKAFSLAVIAALPGAATTAKAASVAAVAAKGGASLQASALGMMAASVLGPLVGVAGAYFGYRVGLEQAIVPEERRFIRRFSLAMVVFALLFLATPIGLIFWARSAHPGSGAIVAAIVIPAIAYGLLLAVACIWYSRRIRRLRAEAIARQPELLPIAQAASERWNIEHRSRWTLLGLPLIHVNIGLSPEGKPPIAKGWIAVGAKAYGILIAFGAVAVAPLSFGGIALGLFAFGGIGLGLLVLGGFGVGIWTLGGVALGWKTIGGIAVAWSAASGGVAVARDFAEGGLALARHANDPAAAWACGAAGFFRTVKAMLPYLNWLWLLWLLPLILVTRQSMKIRRFAATGDGEHQQS